MIKIRSAIITRFPTSQYKKKQKGAKKEIADESIRNKTVIEYYADKIQEENEGRASYREIGIINKCFNEISNKIILRMTVNAIIAHPIIVK